MQPFVWSWSDRQLQIMNNQRFHIDINFYRFYFLTVFIPNWLLVFLSKLVTKPVKMLQFSFLFYLNNRGINIGQMSHQIYPYRIWQHIHTVSRITTNSHNSFYTWCFELYSFTSTRNYCLWEQENEWSSWWQFSEFYVAHGCDLRFSGLQNSAQNRGNC